MFHLKVISVWNHICKNRKYQSVLEKQRCGILPLEIEIHIR